MRKIIGAREYSKIGSFSVDAKEKREGRVVWPRETKAQQGSTWLEELESIAKERGS